MADATVLVTGGAGFIGSHLCQALLEQGLTVYCLDNLDPYYDPAQKKQNLDLLEKYPRFYFIAGDICQPEALNQIPAPQGVFHLAARVGVRPSIAEPLAYVATNVAGTLQMLEYCRLNQIPHFIFSSSSSVYGAARPLPWQEDMSCSHPISPYAASKRSAELFIQTYSALHQLKSLSLRFFTVYGPRQRPDLAIHKFTRQIYQGQPVTLYGTGQTQRDYTFVSDIVAGILQGYAWLQQQPPATSEIVNLGSQSPVTLREMVETLARLTGRTPPLAYLPDQPGDLQATGADIAKAHSLFGYTPSKSFQEGVQSFLQWFQHTRE